MCAGCNMHHCRYFGACRAHNTLFIAELASQQHRLPPHLQSKAQGSSKSKGSGKGAKAKHMQEELSSSAADDSGPVYEKDVGSVSSVDKSTAASGEGRSLRAKRMKV